MLIQKGYNILQLDTYFTSGPEETELGQFQKTVQLQKLREKFILILKKVL